ncbi:MAG TPA: protein kinase [Herpetosiphonaceae bacterium]
MKQDCLLCERTSPDNNLYCQQIYCPAEMSPNILDHGEWLGNIEIVKPIMVLRSSVIYEARYQKNKVLLKVAHPGTKNRERLKREALFLQSIQGKKAEVEHLPRLLPPYTNARVENEPYGKVVLRGHLLYYCLFEYFSGEPLRGILSKNRQMWVYHIGWIMTNLAAAVAFLQSKGRFHYGISPDVVLTRLGDDTSAPGILLFDLGVASDDASLAEDWHRFFVRPAYTAPELIDAPTVRANYATDVYGLGLTLYELLVGEPPYSYKLSSDDAVYEAVRQRRRVEMTRSADVAPAAKIALKATDERPESRYPNALAMAQELEACFGQAPVKSRGLSLRLSMLVVGAVLAIIILIVVVAMNVESLSALTR